MTSWIVRKRPNPAASLRLFCFPYAGGGASIYRDWHASLPGHVEVCAVQLPGRESRLAEAPFRQLPPLVEALAPALLPHLDKPFAFFGHSMGALVGFELARRLRQSHGLRPAYLFVSGCRAPQLVSFEEPTFGLPEPEFIDELRRLNGTPAEVLENRELIRLMIPMLRADFELVQTYAYREEPPLDCSIYCYGGEEDEETRGEHLEGWRFQAGRFFGLWMLPGDHFFLHSSQAVLLRALSQKLNYLKPRD